jgi:hypothetical protein
MTDYYSDIRVLIDPEQSYPLSDGGRMQDVSVILTDDAPDDEGQGLPPSAITLRPEQARAFAFALLVCAEHAERIEDRA